MWLMTRIRTSMKKSALKNYHFRWLRAGLKLGR